MEIGKQNNFIMKKELRYYTPLLMGFALCLIGIFTPPVGEISTGVLYASGMFLILCAAVVGADIPSILHEIRLIKQTTITAVQNEYIKNKEENNNIE